MSFDCLVGRPIGRTGVAVTRLGFGAAEMGGVYEPVEEGVARAAAERAWEMGIRYFDVAPLYGCGLAETRLGAVLRGHAREEYVLSTKVGRLLRPDHDRRLASYFDFSYDAVLRSLDESLQRLGLDRVDILFIHDPDEHWEEALRGAYPALERLRAEGVVRAIGAGMNQVPMLCQFARETELDVFLLAGRYTLLDQEAYPELLDLCLERRISLVLGGVLNSGILADPRPGAHFNYEIANPQWVDRAQQIAAVCRAHGVSLKEAAVQFPLAHPAITSLLAGSRRVDHLSEYPALMEAAIPPALWDDLRSEGLIPQTAPTPDGAETAR